MERVVDKEGGTLGWSKRKHGAKNDVEKRHVREVRDGERKVEGLRERQKWTYVG